MTRWALAVSAAVALVIACAAGGACSTAGSGGVCTYPAKANAPGDASTSGCKPSVSGTRCMVSNGATVLPDGGVANGTESCSSLCGGGEYELTCSNSQLGASAVIPSPDPSLRCTVLALPTPSNALFYCCACAN